MVINSPCLTDKKEFAIPRQTAIGKEFSNPLMADLKFVDQHNMVAYLEKSDDNTKFHQIVDFFSSCSINYALTQIHAIVDGKAVVISESSVRRDLLFDDKDDSKKFLMYVRFLQLFLNNQLKDLPEPFNDTYDTPCHTKKVFSNMARKSANFSRKVTPPFDSMLVQNQAPESEGNGYSGSPRRQGFQGFIKACCSIPSTWRVTKEARLARSAAAAANPAPSLVCDDPRKRIYVV
nr:hypothetical protein [Tanacetum cinerariifolium]